MRTVFLGTPAAAVPSLAALADVSDVALVVTRPDRPKGRSGRPTPSAVKLAAREWGVDVAQPASRDELHATLDGLGIDLGVVVAFGALIPRPTLETTRLGFVNVHFSLLPRWRGAAPVERSILNGDAVTGVSLMVLDEGLDTGPVISAIDTPIGPDETGGSLTARLSHLGADMLANHLELYAAGGLVPAPQMNTGASHAARLQTEEGHLDITEPADDLVRRIRALQPRPGTFLQVEGSRLGVITASISDVAPAPGVIAGVDGHPVLGTADGGVVLHVVQPAGKGRQDGRSWLNGRRGDPATVDV